MQRWLLASKPVGSSDKLRKGETWAEVQREAELEYMRKAVRECGKDEQRKGKTWRENWRKNSGKEDLTLGADSSSAGQTETRMLSACPEYTLKQRGQRG